MHLIGVREESGKLIVDSLSRNEATVVGDPTILLTAEEWNEFISDSPIVISPPYIFCYFLGTNINAREAVNDLKKKTGFTIVAIKHGDEFFKYDESFGDISLNDVDAKDFVKLIKNAEYVCTDSFHCTLFSILFHKKFMTFYRFNSNVRTSRNTRIDNLLEIFDLNNRLYHNTIFTIEQNINYSLIDEKLLKYRTHSIEFLRKELLLAN